MGQKGPAADGSLAGKARCQYGEEERRNFRFPKSNIYGYGEYTNGGDYPKRKEERFGKGKRLTMHREPIAWLSPGVGHL